MRSAAASAGAKRLPSWLSTSADHLAAGGRRQAAGRGQQFQRDVGQRVALDFGQNQDVLGAHFNSPFSARIAAMRAATSASEPESISARVPDTGGVQLADRDQRLDGRRGHGRLLELRGLHRGADAADRHVPRRLIGAQDAQHGRQFDLHLGHDGPGELLAGHDRARLRPRPSRRGSRPRTAGPRRRPAAAPTRRPTRCGPGRRPAPGRPAAAGSPPRTRRPRLGVPAACRRPAGSSGSGPRPWPRRRTACCPRRPRPRPRP